VEPWRSDAGAAMLAHHRFDAASIAPQVAAPDSPANAAPAAGYGDVRVNLAYIGACTGAKLADLRMAARVLKGRKAAQGVRLMVAPASLRDQRTAEREGTLGTLVEAGAELLPNACGACAGYGSNQFGAHVVAISTTARNFKGRMGAPASRVYLGSPYTVAASAVAGRIRDPREML
jgi:3-isopropylmalate/(R)-2-methylmalate dehydratase large subunit